MSLIAIQDRYISRVIEARQKWSHRKDGGHADRSRRAASREARTALSKLGFTAAQVDLAMRDAADMVALELNAE